MLSNGKDLCPYIENFKCTIYENRPKICKAYPLSTDIDNMIYYDINCPGLSENGFDVVKNGKVSQGFDSYIFDDYQTKYINTHNELENFNQKDDFELVTSINNNHFFKYIGSKKSQYISFHKESLINLKNYDLNFS